LDYAAVVFLEILYMIAFLALISAGLAVVFGMMRVINLAHGEFVMIGGYTTIFCNAPASTSGSRCWCWRRSWSASSASLSSGSSSAISTAG
jgi:Branched-chain amino acid ABC-type transport system, permease components